MQEESGQVVGEWGGVTRGGNALDVGGPLQLESGERRRRRRRRSLLPAVTGEASTTRCRVAEEEEEEFT